MSKSLRLKRHETFSIREGWLEKGINLIPKDSKCLSKDNGPAFFGLGTNMCKSLRYWLEASGIARITNGEAKLSHFGDLLFTYDSFLENDISWWLIHCNLAMNKEDAPVINAFFNMQVNKIEKDYIFRKLKEEFGQEYGVVGADSSLDSDISIMLKSYYSNDTSNPENNMNCPLSRLGLISLADKHIYSKQPPAFISLDYRVVFYNIIKCMDIEKNSSFNVEDLCKKRNNPMRIFNISRSTLFLYLEEMRKNGFIKIVKTAGLNTVSIVKILTLDEIFIDL